MSDNVFDDETLKSVGALMLDCEILYQRIQDLQKQYDQASHDLRAELKVATNTKTSGVEQ